MDIEAIEIFHFSKSGPDYQVVLRITEYTNKVMFISKEDLSEEAKTLEEIMNSSEGNARKAFTKAFVLSAIPNLTLI